jgi:hypothetical protein
MFMHSECYTYQNVICRTALTEMQVGYNLECHVRLTRLDHSMQMLLSI